MAEPQKELRLRVMAEYMSSGIWVIGERGAFRHGMIEHASLKLPTNLAQAFNDWIEWYEDNLSTDEVIFDIEKFNAEGLRLATELKKFLGSDVYVEFVPEGEKGLGQSLEIKLDTE
ncbi:MAG: hypothetical protein ABI690_15010 [Chloroflexota bacterium]